MSIDPEVKRALDMRLARGEISHDEYRRAIASVEGVSQNTSYPGSGYPGAGNMEMAGRPVIQYYRPVILSKGLYLGGYLSGVIFSTILYIIGMILIFNYEPEAGLVLFMFSALISIFPMVLYCVLVYKMWQAIQPYGRSTPGKAVGFLFIPFYNLYWIFIALKGWFDDYNKLIMAKRLNIPKLPDGIALAVCILAIVSMVPYIGLLVVIPNLILICVMISFICNGVNALSRINLHQNNYKPANQNQGNYVSDSRYSQY